jgi:predicted RNase H-like HicB family nuclease
MKKARKLRRFTVVLERDEDGLFVASIPVLKGCHTQGKTLDQAMERIREAAELWLEVHKGQRTVLPPLLEFVGVQELEIPALSRLRGRCIISRIWDLPCLPKGGLPVVEDVATLMKFLGHHGVPT